MQPSLLKNRFAMHLLLAAIFVVVYAMPSVASAYRLCMSDGCWDTTHWDTFNILTGQSQCNGSQTVSSCLGFYYVCAISGCSINGGVAHGGSATYFGSKYASVSCNNGASLTANYFCYMDGNQYMALWTPNYVVKYQSSSVSCGSSCVSQTRTCQSDGTWSGSYTATSCSQSGTAGYVCSGGDSYYQNSSCTQTLNQNCTTGQSCYTTSPYCRCSNGLTGAHVTNCACDSGYHQSGTSCVINCSVGYQCSGSTSYYQYSDCTTSTNQTCSSGQSCTTSYPYCACTNGLNVSSYPSCACPANQHQSGSTCVPDYTCSGTLSGNMCSGDDTNLTSASSWHSVASCTSAKCEYTPFVCTGTTYGTICPGSDTGLTGGNQAWNGATSCTGAKCEYVPYTCGGTLSGNACSGDDTNLTTPTNWNQVASCTSAKCEYTPYACTGTKYGTTCSGSDTGLTGPTAWTSVTSCTGAKCEYTPYTCSGTMSGDMCSGDDTNLSSAASWHSVASCTSAKCEYTPFACTGTLSGVKCSGADTGLAASSPWTPVTSCSGAKCEYTPYACTGSEPTQGLTCAGSTSGLTGNTAWGWVNSSGSCGTGKCKFYCSTQKYCSNSSACGTGTSGDYLCTVANNSTCSVSGVKCSTGFTCSAGACVQIPAALYFNVAPLIVQRNAHATVSWSSTNTTSCTVTGTNGDSWTGTSSGASGSSCTTSSQCSAGSACLNNICVAGKDSAAIQNQTVYTIHCTSAVDGSTLTQSATVNILPVFCEPGTQGCAG